MAVTRSRFLSVGLRQAAPMQKRVAPRALAAAAAADHLRQGQEALGLQVRAMADALGAVATILGTGPGLDAEQGADLDLIGVEAGSGGPIGRERSGP
jgi:hypothetical protein